MRPLSRSPPRLSSLAATSPDPPLAAAATAGAAGGAGAGAERAVGPHLGHLGGAGARRHRLGPLHLGRRRLVLGRGRCQIGEFEALLLVQHRHLELHRLGQHREVVDHAGLGHFGGGHDVEVAVVEDAAQPALRQASVVHLLQAGVAHLLVEDALGLDHAAVGDQVLLVAPGPDLQAEEGQRHDQQHQGNDLHAALDASRGRWRWPRSGPPGPGWRPSRTAMSAPSTASQCCRLSKTTSSPRLRRFLA